MGLSDGVWWKKELEEFSELNPILKVKSGHAGPSIKPGVVIVVANNTQDAAKKEEFKLLMKASKYELALQVQMLRARNRQLVEENNRYAQAATNERIRVEKALLDANDRCDNARHSFRVAESNTKRTLKALAELTAAFQCELE